MARRCNYAGPTAASSAPAGAFPSWPDLLLIHALPVQQLPLPWRRRIVARQWYADWGRDSDRDVEVMPGSCLLMRREDLWLDDELLLYFPEDTLGIVSRARASAS